MNKINFLLCLHNHQPTGNFDSVFEMACDTAYEPFLDVLDHHPAIRVTLHYSGCLLEWIENRRPALIDRIAKLVEEERVELMGGGYFEPILAMLPDRDKIGQLEQFREYLQSRFGAKVRGAWLTERVWEQSLVTPMVQAGVEYTIVDDSHFRNAGLRQKQPNGYYLTEDQGNLLAVFPGSERLRYLIPFDDPWKTTDFLGSLANESGDAILAYGDDGEKFGVWPGTHKHVFENGWLESFFEEMERQTEWVNFITYSEAIDRFGPRETIYLPDASYREMMEWALPADTLIELEDCAERLKECGEYDQAARFLRGGIWRNFKYKYPELADMYGRMLRVSEKVKSIEGFADVYDDALMELYRCQCCCAWWHGVFGGLYLPHLRLAVFEHLLRAESIADKAVRDEDKWLDAEVRDINLDTRPEVLLSNGELIAGFVPHRGGHLTEMSLPGFGVNLLNTITRRKEAYHRDVPKAQLLEETGGQARSIHDVILCKEKGLEKYLNYDWYRRDALIDHFFGPETSLDAAQRCEYDECGDFVEAAYDFDIKREDKRLWLQLNRSGQVRCEDVCRDVSIEKVVCFETGSRSIEIGYRLENPGDADIETIFGVEFNAAFLGCDKDGFQLVASDGEGARSLEEPAEFAAVQGVGVVDRVTQTAVRLAWADAAAVWAFPVFSVCNSEAGFEKTFQNLELIPRWDVRIPAGGDWQMTISFGVDRIPADLDVLSLFDQEMQAEV